MAINNCGPSVIRALGQFEGVKLLYWPNDSGFGSYEHFRIEDAIEPDVAADFVAFKKKKRKKKKKKEEKGKLRVRNVLASRNPRWG